MLSRSATGGRPAFLAAHFPVDRVRGASSSRSYRRRPTSRSPGRRLGPRTGVPFEGATVGRNDPFGWAGEFSYRIEAAIERTAHELAGIGVDSEDLLLADPGVSNALRAVPSSIVLCQDHLRLDATLGGRRELARRMETARSSMGGDITALEPFAHELCWDG
jgi:hypothetical protein